MTTYYIDPTAAANGAGTAADPKNTWVGLTLTANNTYLQKRGTTHTGVYIKPTSQVSSAGTPLTIGAYYNSDGSDDTSLPRPIINHNGGANGFGAITIDTCTNVLVRDVDCTNSLGALGAGVRIQRSNGVTVSRCVGRDSTHGILVVQDQAAVTTTTTDITIEDCTTSGNRGSGIHMRTGAASTAIIKRIRLLRNAVTNNGLGTDASTRGGITCQNVYTTDTAAAYRSADIVCEDNEVYLNRSYGVNLYMFTTDTYARNSVSRNHVWGNGVSQDIDTHSLWVGSCFNTDVDHNRVHDNYGWVGGTDGGAGIYLDFTAASATGGDNNRVRNNRVWNQWQGDGAASLPSAGIHVQANTNCTIENNTVVNCRNGIAIMSGANDNVFRFNSVVGCDSAYPGGHGIALTTGTGNTLVNNVVDDCRVGIFCATSGTSGFAETYNSVSRVTTEKTVGTFASQTAGTLDASDITPADPLLSPSYHPLPGSPLISAGTHLGYQSDLSGALRHNPPTIGALEPLRSRAARL